MFGSTGSRANKRVYILGPVYLHSIPLLSGTAISMGMCVCVCVFMCVCVCVCVRERVCKSVCKCEFSVSAPAIPTQVCNTLIHKCDLTKVKGKFWPYMLFILLVIGMK